VEIEKIKERLTGTVVGEKDHAKGKGDRKGEVGWVRGKSRCDRAKTTLIRSGVSGRGEKLSGWRDGIQKIGDARLRISLRKKGRGWNCEWKTTSKFVRPETVGGREEEETRGV